MKARTHLSLAQTTLRPVSRQGAQERRRKQDYIAWKTRLTRAEKQRLIKPGLRATDRFSATRAASVEALRAQVKSGTYEIDSRALAEKLLFHPPCDAPSD